MKNSRLHRPWRCLLTLAMASLCAATTGCLAIPRVGDDPQVECTRHFDLDSTAEPLGSSEAFIGAAEGFAAATNTSPTLNDIAHSAGWRHDGWDRLLKIGDHNQSEDVNVYAGTSGICFAGFVSSDPDRGGSDGWYIFFHGPDPVQTIRWGYDAVIDTDGNPVLGRDERLSPDQTVTPPVLRRTNSGTS